jgi:hypothetical protein
MYPGFSAIGRNSIPQWRHVSGLIMFHEIVLLLRFWLSRLGLQDGIESFLKRGVDLEGSIAMKR